MHFLVIPKHRNGLTQLSKCDERHENLLGHLLVVASKVALQGEWLPRVALTALLHADGINPAHQYLSAAAELHIWHTDAHEPLRGWDDMFIYDFDNIV